MVLASCLERGPKDATYCFFNCVRECVWVLTECLGLFLRYRCQTQRVCVDVRQPSLGPQANSQTLKTQTQTTEEEEEVRGHCGKTNGKE